MLLWACLVFDANMQYAAGDPLLADSAQISAVTGTSIAGKALRRGSLDPQPNAFCFWSSLSHLQEVLNSFLQPQSCGMCNLEVGQMEVDVLNEIGWNCVVAEERHTWEADTIFWI